ncbi:TetR/AcrR family transcriptional regulator [Paenibacillus medicaginis]|uniref:TetR/AcrR family transcriptional regulator n=1 Tax=Paenibacillus medicaginis TaxID=1470560 RepID=A0ABV5BY65_9BACL
MSPRQGLTLQRVLQAAEEIANEQGMGEVTLTTLAGKLQIRPPSLYNHISGMAGLRRELAMYSMRELEGVLTRAAVGHAGREAVLNMAAAYIEFARTRPGLYEAMMLAPNLKDEEVRRISDKAAEVVFRVLSAGYSLTEEEVVHAVRGWRSLLHGFASIEGSGGFEMPVGKDDSLRFVMDIFTAGLEQIRYRQPEN